VQLVNQMMLNNRRMYTDLKSKLLLGDVDRRRRLHQQWTKALDMWKQWHVDAVIDQFQ